VSAQSTTFPDFLTEPRAHQRPTEEGKLDTMKVLRAVRDGVAAVLMAWFYVVSLPVGALYSVGHAFHEKRRIASRERERRRLKALRDQSIRLTWWGIRGER
jgi:hypothetical protein